MAFIRPRIKRRSTSSCVSPGPRKPMPPFWRSKWVQPRTNRVDICCSWASSTCNFPSKVFARCAKISRMRATRSITRHSIAPSILRVCAGDKSWLKITRSAQCALTAWRISSTLPLPIKNLILGKRQMAFISKTGSMLAETASSWNSSISACVVTRGKLTCIRITTSARAGVSIKDDLQQADYSPAFPASPSTLLKLNGTLRDGTIVDIACL